MDNTFATFYWYDSDTTDTIKIACQLYGVTLVDTIPHTENEIEVTVKGPTDTIRCLIADIKDDSVEPFESKRDLSDNEYQFWLKEELAKFGINYALKLDDDCPLDDNVED